MTAIEQAIKEAMEKGGYMHPGNQHIDYPCNEITLLDPAFWRALGKARGWEERDHLGFKFNPPIWLKRWHRFIDHLASGGDAESFFATIL